MGRDENPAVRAIRLLRLLARAPVSLQELASRLGATEGEVKADIRAVKSAGITIESKTIRGEAWYWVEGDTLARFLGLAIRYGRAGRTSRAS